MNDSFDTMDDLLVNALNDATLNYYAYALARSRSERPTENSARLTMQLIFTQGLKWIELLSRFAMHDYQLMYSVSREYVMAFPTLISIAHPTANSAQLREMEVRVFDLLENNPSEIVWCSFVELVKYRIQKDDQQDKVTLLNRVVAAIDRKTRFVQGVELIQDMQMEGSIQSIYSINSYKVILALVKLYKECCRHFRKKMIYLQSLASNNSLIQWIRTKYRFFFRHYQQEIDKRRQVNSEFVKDVLNYVEELESFVEVEDIAVQSDACIVGLTQAWSIVPERQGDPEDQLNWQYGIITGNYGEDTPSYLSKTINSLTEVPGFLKAYLTRLNQRTLPINELILRTSVIHKAVNKRRDLIEELLEPLMADIIKDFHPYTAGLNFNAQLIFCRKLRLFQLFSAVLKESYFNRLIEYALDMLRKQHFNTFCFLEAINIMQQINQSCNKGGLSLQRTAILTRQKVPDIVNGLLNVIYNLYQQYPVNVVCELREGKMNKILTILYDILSNNQLVVQRLGVEILKQFCVWASEQATWNWGRGIATTPVLMQLIKTCKLCITLIKEDYYCNLQEDIYRLLQLLKHHLSRQFQEQLLEIVIFVLEMEKRVSAMMCEILVNVQRIVSNSKSLYPIVKLLKSLCNNHIAASVLDQWPDLCTFFFNLIGNFIQNVSVHYRSNYPNQFEQIFIIFGQFVQAYEMYLQSHLEMRNNLLRVMQAMDSDELQLQLFIIMDHQRSVHPYPFLHPSKVPTFNRRNTFKMLYIHYCDTLIRNYSEGILNQLLQLHRIQVEKKAKRAFESEINADWPCLQMNTKTYLKQTLEQLKIQGKIDAMELSMTLRELGLKH